LQEAVLGLVVIRIGEFGHLVVEALRRKGVEAEHRHSDMVECFASPDAMARLSSG
jgi:hypothetical protein